MPIDYETILATALASALSGLAGGRVYWLIAPDGTPRPFLVFNPATDTRPPSYIGPAGARGLVAVRAIGATPAAARALLVQAASAIASGLTYTGYTIRLTYDRSPPPLPLTSGAWQSAHWYRFDIAD